MAGERDPFEEGEARSQGTLDAAIVQLIANDKVKVPPYPHVALELDRLLSDDNSTIEDIANCAGTDQAIAAALLRTAGSAAMTRGGGGPLSLKTAVGRLGVRETRRVVFACAFGALAQGVGSLLFIRERLWREAATSAFLAQHIADLRKINKDEAFLCGLLHDFGRVIAVSTLEQLGVKVDPSITDDGPDELEVSLDDLDDDIMGDGRSTVRAVDNRPITEPRSERAIGDIIDRFHVELGLVTATRWNLPPLLVEVIAGHHHPPSASSRPDLVELLTACDDISMLLEDGMGLSPQELEKVSSLRPGEAQALGPEIARLPQRLAPFLSATTSGERPFSRNPLAREREEWKPCKLPARAGTVNLEVCFVHPRGFVVGSDVALPEGNLMSFELEVDGLPLSVWGYPRVGVKEGKRWILDIKPFASSVEVLDALRGLIDAGGG